MTNLPPDARDSRGALGMRLLRASASFLRARFVAGLLIIAPFAITFLIFKFLVGFASTLLQPLFEDWFGYRLPGLGVAILIFGPLLIGILAIHFLGNRVLAALEAATARIPIIGPVFGVSSQFVTAFGGGGEAGFRPVVEIEYPRTGIWMLGFLTDTIEHEDDQQIAVVYIPTAPTPNSGWIALVPIEDVMETNLTVNQALGMIFSAGAASPDRIIRKPVAPRKSGL